MTTAVLEKVDASTVEGEQAPAIQADDRELAISAATMLGYEPFKAAIEKLEERPNYERNLLALLRQHDIKLFRPSDVYEYKRRKVAEAMAKPRRRHKRALLTLCAMAFVTGVGLALAIASTIPWEVFVLAVCALFINMIVVMFTAGDVNRTGAYWYAVPLEEFSGKVPKEALALAVGLKQKAGDTEIGFQVDSLKVYKRPLDPFLFVTLGLARYAIAVWDEPTFDAPPIG